MQFSNPWRLVLFTSWVVILVISAIYVILWQFGITSFNLLFLLFSDILIFLFLIIFLRFVIREFLTEKIKLIYKTIQTKKLTKGEKRDKKLDIRNDVLSDVENEVTQWAETRMNEIDQLRRAELFRKEFLGNVTHELKTPLFNIQGYVSTLLHGEGPDPAIITKYLEKAESNIDRMIAMVDQLEAISHLETGETPLVLSKFNIIPLVQEVYHYLDDQARQRKISLEFAELNPGQVFVNADREKIGQVVQNLVANSIKYGIENGRTKVSFYEMYDTILVEVSDNGIGIEQIHLPRLFERFYRVDKSRSRAEGGSGLGLAIVKHIVEAHGQTLNVRSTPGIGSTFSFTVAKA
jgi:two-component system phosphate regulon sensor histidine kinase PhoR